MKKKYKEFADEFEALCDKYNCEDFDANEVLDVCEEIIQMYSE